MASVRHLGLFPWCFNPAATYFKTADAIRKFAVPMWWRVKEWTLESEFVIYYFNPEIPINTVTDTNVFSITDIAISPSNASLVQKETDLVCAGVAYDQESGIQYRTTYDWTFPFQIGNNSLGEGFNECALILGPNFFFEVDADDTRGVTIEGDGAILGNLNLGFCGLSFSAPLRQPYLYESLAMVQSCSCTLTATEYWPYDPGDGLGPIYDSTTGARLRDFPLT